MRNKRLIILLSVLGGIVLVILLSSIIFAVHNVDAACENAVDDSLDMEVVLAADVGLENMFFLDKQEIIDRVDETVINAEMTSITSIFPNKIVLNYNKLYEDVYFTYAGHVYASSASGKIQSDSVLTASGIEVALGQAPLSVAVGSYFNDSDSQDIVALQTLINDLYRLTINGEQVFTKELYSSIDLSQADVTIKTVTGATFILCSNPTDTSRVDSETMLSQLSIAISAYLTRSYSGDTVAGSYIVLYNNDGEAIYSAV